LNKHSQRHSTGECGSCALDGLDVEKAALEVQEYNAAMNMWHKPIM
jgi:hypothetical protein